MGKGCVVAVTVLIALPMHAFAAAVPPTTAPATRPFRAVADPAHLHNAHTVTDKVISGAQPEGEAAFKRVAASCSACHKAVRD